MLEQEIADLGTLVMATGLADDATRLTSKSGNQND